MRRCILKIAETRPLHTADDVKFVDFQNACPHKLSGHFARYCTQLHYYLVLQTARVSAFVLISTPHAMTCEHCRKNRIFHYGRGRFRPVFKMHLHVSAAAISEETPLGCSSVWYYKQVEYQLLYSFLPNLPWPVNMVAKFEIVVFGDFRCFDKWKSGQKHDLLMQKRFKRSKNVWNQLNY